MDKENNGSSHIRFLKYKKSKGCIDKCAKQFNKYVSIKRMIPKEREPS